MLPLECRYLNKNALTTLAGPLTPPVKHFQLKRKPKSATLRAELLQKCECRGLRPGWGRPARPGLGGPAGLGSLAAGKLSFCSMSVVFILRFPSGFMVPIYLLKTVFYIIFCFIRNSLIAVLNCRF